MSAAESRERAEKLVKEWRLHVARDVWGYSPEIAEQVQVPIYDLAERIAEFHATEV